ncbi:MAG: hypothetical protein ACPGZP_08300 [Panacagrimonas sp.]
MAFALILAAPAIAKKDTVRPAVGKPLQAAQALIQEQKYKEALVQIDKAEAVGKLSEYENFVINQLLGSASAGAGDAKGAARAFDTVIKSGRLPAEENLKITEAVAGTFLRAKNYAGAVEWLKKYKTMGGKKADALALLPQAYYLSGDYKAAAREAAAQIVVKEKAGQKPSESQIKILASALVKQKDMLGYTAALERLVRYYPKPEYWADVIQRTATKSGFSDKLTLDMYRLLRATGTMEDARDYVEMAQLAVQAGVPGEAQQVLAEGYEKKLLGQGDQADRHTRLKKLVDDKVAEDKKTIASADAQVAAAATGDPLVKTGLAYVTYGEAEKGLKMMQDGIKKGELKRPEHAKLHLGYAYYLAGQKDQAIKTLRTVKGKDGSGDFARLMMIVAARS